MKLTLTLILITISLLSKGQEIDSVALSKLITESKNSHSDGLAIWFDGKTIFETYTNYDDKLTACHSMQKSLINLCIGKLIDDREIASVDTPLYNYFPEWKQSLKKKITIRHILSHTSGIEENAYDPDGWNPFDIIQYALCSSIAEEPGTTFRYNTKATYILHGLVERVSGKRLDIYLADEFFKPLNIKNYRWDYDSIGNPQLLYTTTGELLKIGQLILQKGKWENKQIVSEKWLDLSFQSSQQADPECGLLWWIIPEKKSYLVNDSLIGFLQNKGVSKNIIEKFNSAKGSYADYGSLCAKYAQVFGEQWRNEFEKYIYPFAHQIYIKTISQNIWGYEARGWMGQYLVVIPDKKLIGVRMIKESSSHQDEKDEMWEFRYYLNDLVNK